MAMAQALQRIAIAEDNTTASKLIKDGTREC